MQPKKPRFNPLVIAIVLVAAVSVRIYTASVLHYGQRLKLKDAMKLKT